MASYDFDPKKGKARIFFRYGGKQYNKTVKVEKDRAANRICALIEDTVQDVERGKLSNPDYSDWFQQRGPRLRLTC